MAHGDLAPDPIRAEPEDDGVDVSLIRWMLSLTPAERLQVLQTTSTRSNDRWIRAAPQHAVRDVGPDASVIAS